MRKNRRVGLNIDAKSKLPGPLFVAAGVVFFGCCQPCLSQEKIGDAQAIINNVAGDLPTGSHARVVQGDSVFLHETVSSGVDSKANLVLKDNSNVTVGPSSTIKLDDFVYPEQGQPATVAVSAADGTLRFITGDAPKRAYTIWTPTAAIGVRGKSLRMKVTPTETKVVNEEGTAIVCLRNKSEYISVEEQRRRCTGAADGQVYLAQGTMTEGNNRSCPCVSLLLPGQQATVTSSEIALSAAAANAIPEPFIGPQKDFSLLAADLPTKKAPLAPIVPVAAQPAIVPWIPLGILGAAGIAAIALAASQSSNSTPSVPIFPSVSP
jgi:hypothetical protein